MYGIFTRQNVLFEQMYDIFTRQNVLFFVIGRKGYFNFNKMLNNFF